MQNQGKSQANGQEMQNIMGYFLQTVPVQSGSQMLQAIKSDSNFHAICDMVGWVLPNGCSEDYLVTRNTYNEVVDPDYIAMNYCNKLAQQAQTLQEAVIPLDDKLERCLQTLQQLQMKIDCMISELGDKTEWIKAKTKQCQSNKQSAMEDCQILHSQNRKLQNELRVQSTQKQNVIGSNNTYSHNKSHDSVHQLQLYQILDRFHCRQTGFPKNKNQAMRLLNNLQVIVQRLQVQKLSFT